MAILVLNAGSSSLKASLIHEPGGVTLATTTRELGGQADARLTVAGAISQLETHGTVEAVGHRVVHGGTSFVEPTVVDASAIARIRELDALAPLHNAVAAEVIEAAQELLPGVPHVACFDTAFHHGLPEAWRRYPVPEAWGAQRFGFHGLSVAWAFERAAALLGTPPEQLSLVVAHLGSGSSVTAVDRGVSVNTSMGMTPLEGLMMGTRAGSIDPGILLKQLRSGAEVETLAEALEHGSGLAAVSGQGADVRKLEAASQDGDARASLALEMFAARAAAGIAAMATSLERLDAVVFTGGIGEGSHAMRRAICERLSALGVPLPGEPPSDEDAVLAADGGPVIIRVTAREDLVIARQVSSR
jgi:acetate kinase